MNQEFATEKKAAATSTDDFWDKALSYAPNAKELIGSGKRVLVAAEEADYINIIDAQTFRSKQTVDVFAEIGGVSFTNSGQDLTVLCYDPTRGGLLQLERCGMSQMMTGDFDERGLDYQYYGRHMGGSGDSDWLQSSFTEEKRIKDSVVWRSQRRAALADLGPCWA